MTNSTPAISLTGLTKRFGSLTAVDALDLEVPAGQILALLGPNGAGKSTTTEMVLGLTKPDAGTARVFGATPTEAVRGGDVGAMLQNGALLAETALNWTFLSPSAEFVEGPRTGHFRLGKDDLLPLNRLFAHTAAQLGVPLHYQEESGGHEWIYWQKQIEKFIVAL